MPGFDTSMPKASGTGASISSTHSPNRDDPGLVRRFLRRSSSPKNDDSENNPFTQRVVDKIPRLRPRGKPKPVKTHRITHPGTCSRTAGAGATAT